MKHLLFFCSCFFTILPSIAQTSMREDLPIYHSSQQRKEQIINFLDRQLAAYQGLYFKYDSLKLQISSDSVLLKKLQQQAFRQETPSAQRKEMRTLFYRNIHKKN